jgi:branched-chain amino acid transport system substrate-binding protein
LGAVTVPYLQGAQIWVRHINANGGLNGHAVKLLVYDDGADPARHRSQVQEAVERQKALAFLMNGEPTTGEGTLKYISEKRVPVVGITTGETWAYASPMYFPQASSGDALYKTFVPAFAKEVLPQGKDKLGSIVCAEVPGCAEVDRIVAESASANGFDLVYRAKASIAQPDYTAECLAARNAGVEVLFVLLEQNSVTRLSSACARQAYRPTVAIFGPAVTPDQPDNPNLDGMVALTPTFPWFQTGTPATDEFQQAMREYGQGIRIAGGLSIGWTAGKLLERAASNLPEPPTVEAILAGLWSIRDETLGGLTNPMTFIQDKLPQASSCWFALVLKDRAWKSPDGFRLNCLPR